MLYADKRALETNLKVSLLQIREKELNFYTQNCLAVGTQAALLAGFAYAGLTQVSVPKDAPYIVKVLYLLFTTAAMSFELIAVLNTTLLSMLGPGLALRGPDGSMHKAVDGMMYEYRKAFFTFGLGLIAFHFSALMFGWLMFRLWVSISITVCVVFALRILWRYAVRIFQKFQLPKDMVISGRFSPETELSGQAASGQGPSDTPVDPNEQQTLSRLIQREQQVSALAGIPSQAPGSAQHPYAQPYPEARVPHDDSSGPSAHAGTSGDAATTDIGAAGDVPGSGGPTANEQQLQRQGLGSWFKFM